MIDQPENGLIIDQLLQISDNRFIHENLNAVASKDDNEDNESDDLISRTFVPALPPGNNEDDAIRNTLNRLQSDNPCNENLSIDLPNIDSTPIDEFHTVEYIACAFSTLFPRGAADLRAQQVREVKPAEYFQHLLKYKNGRFACHPCWRYFVLNSLMRWRALAEGRIYVKQNLEAEQLTVAEVQELLQSDTNMANRVVRFGEGLRSTRQYWMRHHAELTDMIKQLGSSGMIFFTFSAADMHWPKLHVLMPYRENVTEESIQEAARHRCQDLIDNLHIVAWFFEKRFKVFFEKVLIPK